MSVLLSVSVLERNLYQRDNVRVILLLTFPLKQIVVSAARRAGKFPADQGPGVVNGALPCLLIQERASLAK